MKIYKSGSGSAERPWSDKPGCHIWRLGYNTLIIVFFPRQFSALEHRGWFHDRAQCSTKSPVHVSQTNLVTRVHPSASFAGNKLEINPHIAVFDLDLVGHVDNIKFLWYHSVKVDKGFCNAIVK